MGLEVVDEEFPSLGLGYAPLWFHRPHAEKIETSSQPAPCLRGICPTFVTWINRSHCESFAFISRMQA